MKRKCLTVGKLFLIYFLALLVFTPNLKVFADATGPGYIYITASTEGFNCAAFESGSGTNLLADEIVVYDANGTVLSTKTGTFNTSTYTNLRPGTTNMTTSKYMRLHVTTSITVTVGRTLLRTNYDCSGSQVLISTVNTVDPTPAGNPTNFTLTSTGTNTVRLSWKAPNSSSLNGFNVYKNGTKLNGILISKDIFAYDVAGLVTGMDYTFKVTSVSLSGFESNGVTVTGKAVNNSPPPVPTGLTAKAYNGHTLLSWPAVTGVNDLAGYNIYLNGKKVNTSNVVVLSYDVSGLSNNVTNMFYITAINTSGIESAPSNSVYTNFDTISPLAPVGLVATAHDTFVDLKWTPNTEPDLAGYNAYVDKVRNNSSLISVSSYTVANLIDKQKYAFNVTALDFSGNESSMSETVYATPLDTTPPSAPTNLTGFAGDTIVKLSWSPVLASDLVGYFVYKGTERVNSVPLTDTSYTVTGLTNYQSYAFTVTAIDDSDNESVKSNVFTVQPVPVPKTDPPADPSNIIVQNNNGHSLVYWTNPHDVDFAGSNIYLDTVKQNKALLAQNFFQLDDLENGKTYHVRITSVDTFGNESKGNIVLVTPSAKGVPSLKLGFNLTDIATSTSNWFGSFWWILAFAIAIPLSFFIAHRVKQLF